MQPALIPTGTSWFSRTSPDSILGANLVAFTEPFLNDYFRANFYHLKGRDLDLVVDTGMGLAPLVPLLDLTPGKPVLAVNVVSYWHALRQCGIEDRVLGYGRVLEEF